jgi:hypothetical protein
MKRLEKQLKKQGSDPHAELKSDPNEAVNGVNPGTFTRRHTLLPEHATIKKVKKKGNTDRLHKAIDAPLACRRRWVVGVIVCASAVVSTSPVLLQPRGGLKPLCPPLAPAAISVPLPPLPLPPPCAAAAAAAAAPPLLAHPRHMPEAAAPGVQRCGTHLGLVASATAVGAHPPSVSTTIRPALAPVAVAVGVAPAATVTIRLRPGSPCRTPCCAVPSLACSSAVAAVAVTAAAVGAAVPLWPWLRPHPPRAVAPPS